MLTDVSESSLTIPAAEWDARQELASCYRVFALLGWTELIYNHITLRVPGEEGAFLINPYGLHFSEVTASNLIKIDIDGRKLSNSAYGVNLAGFVQHALFHRHLPDAHCIAHTHTTAGMAVSSLEEGLLPINFYGAIHFGQIGYHDFEGVTVRSEEGERLLKNLGDCRTMLLRNHGILAMGRTVGEAFQRHWELQRACEVQMATLAMGKPTRVPDDVIMVHQRDLHLANVPTRDHGRAALDAIVRLVDRHDRSWRD